MKHNRIHVAVLAFGLMSVGPLAWAKDYKIDPGHSNVGFTATHLISRVNGSFKEFSGSLSFDSAKPEASKVSAEVTVATVDTNEPKRDQHLQGADFFDAAKFPKMTFVSRKVSVEAKNRFKMQGDLSLHGVVKPVTFDVEYLGEAQDPWGATRLGFTATSKINRKDFGMNWNKVLDQGGLLVGEEVGIQLNIEAIEKK
ncbi:MAG: YceI family protein [Bdellovibrionia bacterium]